MNQTKPRWRNKIPEVERRKILELSQQCLFREDGKEALKYLTEVRRFKEETLKKFQLGYMPKWVKNVNDVRHELAGRITLPIFDHHNNFIAFSSRDWREDAEQKFWHEKFDKRFFLYGMDRAKKHIREFNKAVIVEGEFDVMMLHQYGIDIAVGIMGSAPQLQQISILSRYCAEVYHVFDPDIGGKKADNTMDEIDQILSFNLGTVRNLALKLIKVNLPEKCDPDDFLIRYGKHKFITLLKESKKQFLKKRGI